MYASKWARAAIMPKNCVPWIRLRCNSSDSASVKPVGHTLFGSDIVFSLWKTPYCSCSTRTRVLWHPLPQNLNNLLFLSVILDLHIFLSIKIYINGQTKGLFPCFKKYLKSRVRSKIKIVPVEEWGYIAALPIESLKKNTSKMKSNEELFEEASLKQKDDENG